MCSFTHWSFLGTPSGSRSQRDKSEMCLRQAEVTGSRYMACAVGQSRLRTLLNDHTF